ncbi:MAG TPA: SpoIIE family protein phosphatase, partial [Capillimicrobium sp.]
MTTGERSLDAPLLEGIMRHAPVGVGLWGLDLRIRRVNAIFAAILGCPVEACEGRMLSELVGEPGARREELFREILRTGEAVHEDVRGARLPSSPDEARDFRTSYFPVRGDDGEIVAIGGVVDELTAQSSAEAERDQVLKEALVTRAHAEAAQVRAEGAQREAERARARTAFIAEAGARMATMLDTERAMAELARISVPAVADWCVISLLDRRERLVPVAVAHCVPEREPIVWELARRGVLSPEDASGPWAVMRSGKPELASEIDDEGLRAAAVDEDHLAALRELGTASSVIVPLKTPTRRIGTVSLVHGDSGRRFTEEDVAMARALSARASLHAENARLYTERSKIAQTLQEALVPDELPAVPGVELAVRYRAAGDQNLVGGDFYDAFLQPDGAVLLVVGDVVGHSVEATAAMSELRSTVRALAYDHGDGPGATLRRTDRALTGLGFGTLATVLVASLERPPASATGRPVLRWSSAGHPPPLLLREHSGVEVLERPAERLL